jgi:ribonuclease E
MTTKMLINALEPEEYRVAFIKDGMLDEFHIETSTAEQIRGNIYKGLVERIEPRLQACFVNFGSEKNGLLPADEIHPEYYQTTRRDKGQKDIPPIGNLVKKGQELLVQVTREMPGRKGAHLTTYLSLAGRYLVLTVGRTTNGISRKIEDDKERQRLKSIMGRLKLPEEIGYIVRTVAAGQNKRELSRDLNRLLRIWKDIKTRAKKSAPLSVIHKEQDVCLRTLRDYYNSEVSEILVDDKETHDRIKEYMKIISPRRKGRVRQYKSNRPIFDQYQVESQIESIYRNQVQLKSGGYIVIDATEALISIDVNSGRAKVGKNIESMAYKNNLEAASEVARQLRLRDMGGLVVIDFIDMRDRKHVREVEKVLREELRKDRAKTDTSNISKFGLMELSRERLRPSIESRSYRTCHYCQGRGTIMSVESAAVSLLRRIWMGLWKGGVREVKGVLPLDVAAYLQNRKRRELAELEDRYGVAIVLEGNPALAPGEGKLEFMKGGAAPAK